MTFDEVVRVKQPLVRCLLSELFGTVILVFVAHSVGASYSIANFGHPSADPAGKIFAITFGVGLTVFIALCCTMHISGGHLNPAVTFSLASMGLFPWSKVIQYMLAHYLGGFIGASLVYLTHSDAIDMIHEKYNGTVGLVITSHLFAGAPAKHATVATSFWGTFFGAAVFLIGVVGVVDHRNLNSPKWYYPLGVAFSLMVSIAAFCANGAPALNPAGDLAPRLFAHLVGWDAVIWSPLGGHYWYLVGIIAPHLGATFGLYIYRLTIAAHIPDDTEHTKQDGAELQKLESA